MGLDSDDFTPGEWGKPRQEYAKRAGASMDHCARPTSESGIEQERRFEQRRLADMLYRAQLVGGL